MTLWSEELKAKMLRLRDEEKMSNQEIAAAVGLTGKKAGDIVRKVLVRYTANKKQEPPKPPVPVRYPETVMRSPARGFARSQPPIMPKDFR